MKIRKNLMYLAGVFIFTLGLWFLFSLPPAEAAPASPKQEFLFRLAGTMPLEHYMTKTLEHFAKLMDEKTKGQVKIEIYPANQLFSDKDLPKALPSGAVDMGQVNMAMWAGLVPLLVVEELPFFFKDRDQYYRARFLPTSRICWIRSLKRRG